jgi:hypothetical protein
LFHREALLRFLFFCVGAGVAELPFAGVAARKRLLHGADALLSLIAY